MTREPEGRGRGRRWEDTLRDKRGPEIRPAETLVDLGFWWVPALAVLAGLVVAASGHVRDGLTVMAAGAAVGAGARAVLPGRLAGGLVARSRVVDVLVWAVMAGLLGSLAALGGVG